MPLEAMSAVTTARAMSSRNRFLFHTKPRWPKKFRTAVIGSPRSSAIHQDDQVDRQREILVVLVLHQDLGRGLLTGHVRAEHLDLVDRHDPASLDLIVEVERRFRLHR